MRAILINSKERTIREVQVSDKNFLEDCYKHIGCSLIEVATTISESTLWVDEEGYCKKVESTFMIVGCPQPFAGNGLFVGYDAEKDENKDTDLTIADVIDIVRWM
ncbi:MAG TPA: hypothetical protein PLE74_01005 [Candidatus Cloacimonadota bacterium]|nr:hypothetical protein [Candidatus Cloacimonadota bacterium]